MFEHMEYVEKETGSSFSNDCATCKLSIVLDDSYDQTESDKSHVNLDEGSCSTFFNEVATSNTLGRRDNAGLHKQVVGRNNCKQGVK